MTTTAVSRRPHARVSRSHGRWQRLGLTASVLAATGGAIGVVLGLHNGLLFLTLIGFVGAVVGLRYPAIGLLSVGIICTTDAPARVFVFTGGFLRFNTFNYWLVLVAVLCAPFVLRLGGATVRTLQLFIVYLLIGFTITPDPAAGIQHVLNIVSTFGLIVYFVAVARDTEGLYWLGVVCGVTGALVGLAYNLQILVLPYIDENAWALCPVTAMLAICLGYSEGGKLRGGTATLSLLLGINAVWVFLSASRGGMMVALCCVLFITMSISGLHRRLGAILAAAVIVAMIATQFTGMTDRALFRVNKLFSSQWSAAGRTSGRSDLLIGGLYISRQHPLGVGTGGFAKTWEQLPLLSGQSGFAAGEYKQAHSAWVKTFAENGIPGGVLLSAFLLSFTVVGWRSRQRRLFHLGLLVTAVLAISFAVTEFQSKGLWFLVAGVYAEMERVQIVAILRQLMPAEQANRLRRALTPRLGQAE